MSLANQNNLETPAIFNKAAAGGFGQIQLVTGGTAASETNQEFASIYAVTDAVFNYTSAASPNYGSASFTSVDLPAGSYFVAHMKTIVVTTGTILCNCLTEDPDA